MSIRSFVCGLSIAAFALVLVGVARVASSSTRDLSREDGGSRTVSEDGGKRSIVEDGGTRNATDGGSHGGDY